MLCMNVSSEDRKTERAEKKNKHHRAGVKAITLINSLNLCNYTFTLGGVLKIAC